MRMHLPAWVAFALLLTPALGRAADEKPKAEGRVTVAQCASDTATCVRRESPDKPWQVVKKDEELKSGDLIVGGMGAILKGKEGTATMTFMGDLDGHSPFPIIETAVILHQPTKGAAFEFTMERGRVD